MYIHLHVVYKAPVVRDDVLSSFSFTEDESWNEKHNKPHKIVKQADVVLLGFPFHYNYSNSETRANDLNIYRAVTDPLGPAMTWGMFCIGYKEIGDETQEAEMFYESFRPYVREPFKVDLIENSASSFHVDRLSVRA